MKLSVAIGGALRDIRTEQGLTLRQVSAKCFVSLGHLSEVERGIKDASTDLLEQISSKGLGLSNAEFLTEVCNYLQGNR